MKDVVRLLGGEKGARRFPVGQIAMAAADGEDIGKPVGAQLVRQGRTDQSGAAGDDDLCVFFHIAFSFKSWVARQVPH